MQDPNNSSVTSNMKEKATSFANKAVNDIKGTAQKGGQRLKESMESARHYTTESLDTANRYVKENPMTSIMVAAAVGALVALLIGATRSR